MCCFGPVLFGNFGMVRCFCSYSMFLFGSAIVLILFVLLSNSVRFWFSILFALVLILGLFPILSNFLCDSLFALFLILGYLFYVIGFDCDSFCYIA